MMAIMVGLAVVIAIVVIKAIFTALGVFLVLSAGKTARRESLLCETKKFEIMNDIKFAKDHMGEYFQWMGRRVRVIGYDSTGSCDSVIVDCSDGWLLDIADSMDIINTELCETGRCHYVDWEDLK